MLREVGSGRRQQVTGGVARGQERVENEMWRMQVKKKTKAFTHMLIHVVPHLPATTNFEGT
jgi:hypothetical protein